MLKAWVLIRRLNESPSKKEGKFRKLVAAGMLNFQNASMKALPKRKGNA